MNASDDNQIPEHLARELRRLVPEPPEAIGASEQQMLAAAHAALKRANGRRRGWWMGAVAAAAAVVIGVAVWQFQPAQKPMQMAAIQGAPTIIDALRAAKRPNARQAEIDQIAMAAVHVSAEVQ